MEADGRPDVVRPVQAVVARAVAGAMIAHAPTAGAGGALSPETFAELHGVLTTLRVDTDLLAQQLDTFEEEPPLTTVPAPTTPPQPSEEAPSPECLRASVPDRLPAGVLEAESELQGLGAEIRSIEAQLGDPNRTDRETGQRLDGAAWEAWRKKAKAALGHKTARYRWLKAWIRTRRQEDALPAREHDPSREAELLCLASGALRLLEELAGGVAAGRPPEVVLTPSRRRAIGGLRAWLDAALAARAGSVGDGAEARA